MRPASFGALVGLAWGMTSGVSAQSADALASPSADTVTDAELDLNLPDPPDLRLDTARLGAFFESEAESERDGQTIDGVVSISAGGLNLGLGLWLMLDDETFAGFDMLRATGGSLAIALGIMGIVSGIHSLSAMGVAQDRHHRWRLALEGGLDARQLGRFEGELRAEAEVARVLRGFSMVTSFATAGGGLAIALATAVAGFDELGQIYGYSFGGLFALVGLIAGFDALLSESRAETNWRRYREGRGPEGEDDIDLSLVPTVSESGLGFQLSGSF